MFDDDAAIANADARIELLQFDPGDFVFEAPVADLDAAIAFQRAGAEGQFAFAFDLTFQRLDRRGAAAHKLR